MQTQLIVCIKLMLMGKIHNVWTIFMNSTRVQLFFALSSMMSLFLCSYVQSLPNPIQLFQGIMGFHRPWCISIKKHLLICRRYLLSIPRTCHKVLTFVQTFFKESHVRDDFEEFMEW